MLEANKSRLFETLFAVYNRNLFRRRFAALQVEGIENLRNRKSELPLVLYANHSSWWDGLVAFEIGRCARLDQFVMMEEKQLKQLFLFRFLGAFSVVREDPREAARSINYAVKILKEKPNRAIWIFPQGEILPNDARPLRFYSGLARVIEKTGRCVAAPIAMRYEFSGEFKPAAFAKIGKPEIFADVKDTKQLTEGFSTKLTQKLGAKLGADVPFFLTGGTALGTGFGTEIDVLPDIPKTLLLIVTPDENVPTGEAYRALKASPLTNEKAKTILEICRFDAKNADFLQTGLHNDFEKTIFRLRPEIARVKSRLLQAGASSALLSGSGASVFAIFDNNELRQQAAALFNRSEPNWRVYSCETVSRDEYRKQLEPCWNLLEDLS